KDLRNLHMLVILDAQVTDATLKALRESGLLHALSHSMARKEKRPADATEVVSLFLGETKVTDAGLKELKDFQGLQKLGLSATVVSDAGLKELANFRGLQELYLRQTKVTGAGLKDIKELSNLKTLDLYDTRVSDEGLKEIKHLHN